MCYAIKSRSYITFKQFIMCSSIRRLVLFACSGAQLSAAFFSLVLPWELDWLPSFFPVHHVILEVLKLISEVILKMSPIPFSKPIPPKKKCSESTTQDWRLGTHHCSPGLLLSSIIASCHHYIITPCYSPQDPMTIPLMDPIGSVQITRQRCGHPVVRVRTWCALNSSYHLSCLAFF